VSYPLTAIAALLVGTVEAFSSFYASNFKEVIVFTLILPVLVLRSLAAPAVEEEKDLSRWCSGYPSSYLRL